MPILRLGPLDGSLARFTSLDGPDLALRCEEFQSWVDVREDAETWPYVRALEQRVGPRAGVISARGACTHGINLASQDYLGLASHAKVFAAAKHAIDEFGVHSAGSPMLLGNTQASLGLERALADFLETDHVMLFPTGWGAGFAVIAGLVRPGDHVVMDRLSHACLQQGAMAATGNVHRTPHLDMPAMIEKIRQVRAGDSKGGILVVTEGLFSMDSDVPDLRDLVATCGECTATLVVDVAHDLGALGPGGTGSLGHQALLGAVDLVMGSFSKTFASNGGFIAARSRSVRTYLKCYGGPHVFSNALSPVQASIVSECLRIVRSVEGDELRRDLIRNATLLRSSLASRGIECYGTPSAIVPVKIGSERIARLASRRLASHGATANLVEFPAVPIGAARFRCQVMATHDTQDMDLAATAVSAALDEAIAEAAP